MRTISNGRRTVLVPIQPLSQPFDETDVAIRLADTQALWWLARAAQLRANIQPHDVQLVK